MDLTRAEAANPSFQSVWRRGEVRGGGGAMWVKSLHGEVGGHDGSNGGEVEGRNRILACQG